MKVLIVCLATAGFALPFNTVAQPTEPVSPEEMIAVCDSLLTYVSLASESKQSGMPLDVATSMTEASMKKNLSGVPADVLNRYRAAVRELFKRIYALQTSTPQSATREIAPACTVYARGLYSESDINRMKVCEGKTQPYLGFANMRDQGMSLDNQLKWLKEEGLKNVPGQEEAARLYSELSEVMKYVYAHPQLPKQAIYSEKFNACFKETNP